MRERQMLRMCWNALRLWGKCLLLGLCGLCCAMPTIADTIVGGVLVGNAQWTLAQSPYVVTSDLVLQNGATLEIEAGVVIYVNTGVRWAIENGSLQAVGTAQAPIRITSQRVQQGQPPAPGDWGTLVFASGAVNTRLEHVLVEYGSGLVVNGAAPIFNHLRILNHQGPAISTDLAASLSGTGNRAEGNTLNAVLVPAGEISQSLVTWGLKGIPYRVSGLLAVGVGPTVTQLSPNGLQQGETVAMTVTGTRLGGLSAAVFEGSGVSVVLGQGGSASSATLSVTAAANAPIGTGALRLLTDAGEVRLADAITVVRQQPKLVTAQPATLYVGQGDAVLTLSGSNFTNGSVAWVDGQPVTTTFINETTLGKLCTSDHHAVWI